MTNGGLYRVGPFVAVAGVLALLSGCGRFGFLEQREPWRAEAELQCLQAGLVKPSAYVQPAGAINGPGTCGMDHAFRVAAWAGGAVAAAQRLTLACPMISRADQWLAEVVQPAAQSVYGAPVVQIKSGSYSCRPRNGQRGAKLSEHGYGNAMDVFSFRFADGREVAVKSGWRGAPEEQQFLREVFAGSCRYFTTVLGPGADIFHYDHIHLDLARHDPRGLRSVCKPVIKYDPLPGEGRIDRSMTSYRAPPPSAPAVAAAPVPPPSGAILSARPFPQQAAPSPPGRVAAAPFARPAGPPISLAPPPTAAVPQAGDEEIDPENDPYAVDD